MARRTDSSIGFDSTSCLTVKWQLSSYMHCCTSNRLVPLLFFFSMSLRIL